MLITAENCYYDWFAGSSEYSPAGMMGSREEYTSWLVSANWMNRIRKFFNVFDCACCKVAHKCLREWKCLNKNAYICLRDWKRLQNLLIFAYRKKCLQILLIFAYRKICLRNLLTKTCLLMNLLVFAWKQVFMLTFFRPLKVGRAGHAGT